MEVTKEIKYGDSVKIRQQFCIKYIFDVNNYKENDRAELLSFIEKNKYDAMGNVFIGSYACKLIVNCVIVNL
jgi:hypothetical protein